MQGKRIAVIVTVICAVAFAIWSSWPGEERRIRSRLEDLAATATERGGPGLGQMAHAAKLAGFFTADAVVDLGPPYPEIRGRETIMALAAKSMVPGDDFAVTFEDVAVTLGPGATSATARLTAVVSGQGPRLLNDTFDARELEIDLLKPAGEWQLHRVTIIEAIQRPR